MLRNKGSLQFYDACLRCLPLNRRFKSTRSEESTRAIIQAASPSQANYLGSQEQDKLFSNRRNRVRKTQSSIYSDQILLFKIQTNDEDFLSFTLRKGSGPGRKIKNVDLLVSTKNSPSLYRVSIPLEILVDGDETTFDSNVQRHSIVSPTILENSAEIVALREVFVKEGRTSFKDRLEETLNGKTSDGCSRHRYVLLEWANCSDRQPSQSPYAIMADLPGVHIPVNGCSRRFSAISTSLFETIARNVVDSVSGTEEKLMPSSNIKIIEGCFDPFSNLTFGGTLSPLFYQNMRVKNSRRNVFSQNTRDCPAHLEILPRLFPVDRIHWDHSLIWGHSKKECGCFSSSSSQSTVEKSHEILRKYLIKNDSPPLATVKTDSRDLKRFQSDSHRLVMMIENLGFAVMEDPSTLGGFPIENDSSGKACPLAYVPPKHDGDKSDVNSNTLLVDFRAQQAEQMITKIFGYVRNCHYGLFSTWSNGNRWKYDDLSDCDVLMSQIDTVNESNGFKRRHTFTKKKTTSGSSTCNLKVINNSGSDPHKDGAYSGIHLDLHTDNTYFVDVPRLQAFGCIFTHSKKTFGGETTLVDGVRVALEIARLCNENEKPTPGVARLIEKYSLDQRRLFLELLCHVPVEGRFEKERHYYNGMKPIINLTKGVTTNDLILLSRQIPSSTDPSGLINENYVSWCRQLQNSFGSNKPIIDSVSFNNSDRAPLNPFVSRLFKATPSEKGPLDLVNPNLISDFYKAYELMHVLLHDPAFAIHFTLKPGQMLFFDNHRVLHGRLEFSGPRVMCGSYVGSDEYYSSLKAACQFMNVRE